MKNSSPQIFEVLESTRISPNFQRLRLKGAVSNWHWTPGAYVKLLLPNTENDRGKSKVRTYTVRSIDHVKEEIIIDFALHSPAGLATEWALNAEVGNQVEFKGPGALKYDPYGGDWYLIAADMAALPAAISVLESLDAHAKGHAVLEITDSADQQALNIPEGIKVTWLIHPHPDQKSNQQLDAIKELSYPVGIPNIFVAGELSTIREIKAYLVEQDLINDHSYVSSYWKIGAKDEEHKMAKRALVST